MYRRRTARVLVVDADDRVLLLGYRFAVEAPDAPEVTEAPVRRVWMAPGGGVQRRESLRKAAARELREEVGLVVDPAGLGMPVAHAEGYADLGWAKGRFRDEYFLYRVDAHEVDITAMESLELSHYAGYHWWSLDELLTTTDNVVPWGLAELMKTLIKAADGRPRPVRLPWHH